MKKTIKLLCMLVFMFCLSNVCLHIQASDVPWEEYLEETITEENVISLNKTKAILYTSGTKTVQLKATVTGKSKKVTWSSSNKKIATVSSKGKVTAKKAGTAVITAKANGKTAKCTVTVIKPSIKLNQKKATIYTTGMTTLQLKPTIKGASSKVKWSSGNKKIATVNANGKVTAKKAGKVTITAKANGKTAKCKVTVVAIKKPTLSSWKKTYDSATDPFVFDGVTYTISWNKVPGATGYEVYDYGWTEDRGWVLQKHKTTKTKFSTSFSHIDMKIKAKVRAYIKVNGKTIYGPWSSVKQKNVTFDYGDTSEMPKATSKFKDLKGKAYTYKNSNYKYGIAFGSNNNKVYIGVWNKAGTSASYEDYLFTIKEGQYYYRIKGMRSGEYNDVTIIPLKNSVFVNLYNKSYPVLGCYNTFSYDKNAYFQVYTEY